MEKYKEEYEKFLLEYGEGTKNPEEIGRMVAQMAGYFVNANLEFAKADVVYNRKLSVIENTADPDSEKLPSSVKAKNTADATPEAEKRIMSKAHVINIETCINALKALQKGTLNEYAHSGLQ